MNEGMKWINKTEGDIRKDFERMKELGVNAVRLSGYDDWIFKIARIANKEGLEVWLNPKCVFVDNKDVLLSCKAYSIRMRKFAKKAAESKVDVFAVGNELSLELSDIAKVNPSVRWRASNWQKFFDSFVKQTLKFRTYVSKLGEDARKNFHGTVTYAAGAWEFGAINWNDFDIVSVNKYTYPNLNMQWYSLSLLEMRNFGKPAVLTEFGFQTIDKALEAGGDWTYAEKHKVRYDEKIQAKLISEHIKLFRKLGLNGWFLHQWQEPDDKGFGIIKSNGKPKKSYFAIRREYKHSF